MNRPPYRSATERDESAAGELGEARSAYEPEETGECSDCGRILRLASDEYVGGAWRSARGHADGCTLSKPIKKR